MRSIFGASSKEASDGLVQIRLGTGICNRVAQGA